ncbi:unnamed protein product, partial [Ectocarpus sp. 6 AP-2014]
MFTRIAAIVQEHHPGKKHKTTRATADDHFHIRAKLAHLKPQEMLQDAGIRLHEHTNRPRNKIIEGRSQIEGIRILSSSSSASGLLSNAFACWCFAPTTPVGRYHWCHAMTLCTLLLPTHLTSSQPAQTQHINDI